MDTLASITVMNLRGLTGRTVYALIDAEISIADVSVKVMGIQARRLPGGGTSVHLPTYRDGDGAWRGAVDLPAEIREALCDAVLTFMVEEGVAKAAPDPKTGNIEVTGRGAWHSHEAAMPSMHLDAKRSGRDLAALSVTVAP